MEYWQNSSLFRIASLVGKPTKVDEQSFSWLRGKFVRICVDLDFTKPLKQGLWIQKPGSGIFQAIRNILWSSKNNDKGLHLIAWEDVTLPKDCGALGKFAEVKFQFLKREYNCPTDWLTNHSKLKKQDFVWNKDWHLDLLHLI
ncbi:hypothetical protein Cni_G02320 [Canna indica]|uniref:Uncharacterized protein n=1 Tax=Canna indica TaxID=4628 RepID=A0AAQ3JSA4_9LILI|nr:hypothetical protein Cni_G02320 [Canna indica]